MSRELTLDNDRPLAFIVFRVGFIIGFADVFCTSVVV